MNFILVGRFDIHLLSHAGIYYNLLPLRFFPIVYQFTEIILNSWVQTFRSIAEWDNAFK